MSKIYRKETKEINLGGVKIGGSNPISVQSMTNTDTKNIPETINQILELQRAGCDIVRIAIPDKESVKTIKAIKNAITIPLVADIHFDYRLAIDSIESGIDGIRINPGNIGSEFKVKKVIDCLKEKMIPIRIGVNSGSVSKDILNKYGLSAVALVESALEHIKILEKYNYHEIKISVKSSSVPLTLEAYKLLSKKVDYPLHLGLTEAGSLISGTVKSSIVISSLLQEGIGDTIRVSLTDNPINEVYVAEEILKTLKMRKGYSIISCPTCGRTQINIIDIVKDLEKSISEEPDLSQKLKKQGLHIAVMGCAVNGPGEAREADIGIAGGNNEAVIFIKGKIVKKISDKGLVRKFIELLKTI